jgi:hypothetical protein
MGLGDRRARTRVRAGCNDRGGAYGGCALAFRGSLRGRKGWEGGTQTMMLRVPLTLKPKPKYQPAGPADAPIGGSASYPPHDGGRPRRAGAGRKLLAGSSSRRSGTAHCGMAGRPTPVVAGARSEQTNLYSHSRFRSCHSSLRRPRSLSRLSAAAASAGPQAGTRACQHTPEMGRVSARVYRALGRRAP